MRKLFLAVLLFGLAFAVPAFTQQRWERIYEGPSRDEGRSVQQTTDGGYIVAGLTSSFGNGLNDVYLIKTNASGDTLWAKTYGGAGEDYGYSVRQTTDGGYIVAGETYSFGNGGNVYLIKTNATGDTLWTRTYGGSNSDWGSSVQQTSDGGYIIAGCTYSFGDSVQVYLIKASASGDTLWTKTYGGAYSDWGSSVQQTSDSGYIVTGYTASFGNRYQVYLIKTNATGDTLWTRTYGWLDKDMGRSVQQTSDGGYIVAGETWVPWGYGDGDVYLIKTDDSGNAIWTRNYGGVYSDAGYSVQQTQDGGYIVTGETPSFGSGSADVYLIKVKPSGDTLWTRTFGRSSYDYGNSVQQTTDGGYIVAGSSYTFGDGYQVYLIKTDANGSSGVEKTAGVRGQRLGVRITPTPNPFTSFATVTGHEAERFSLYDISGRKVGAYKGDRIGEGLSAGVYFLRAEKGDQKPLRIVKVR